ncbi:TMEM43 family protein [Rhizobium sp.]
MSFTETTRTSWFTKLKNGVVGTLIGVVLILVAVYFLFWNEGRAIHTYQALVEGAGKVVSIDSASVDAANEGKLVHITGPVKPNGEVVDPQFDIRADGALAVRRNVEMYQWVEKSESKTEKNVGGSEDTTTTYSYSKEWSSRRVDSSDFKVQSGHENPDFAVPANTVTVDTANVGAFVLDGSSVANLGDQKTIALTQADADRMADNIATSRPVRLNQGEVYIGTSSTSPQVGDLKVRFERTDLAEASFVGKQQGDAIVADTMSNGNEVFLSAAGKKDAPAMFKQAQDENTIITWIIRVAGLIGIFIGFQLFFGLFGVIGDVIPFIGSIVRGGTSIIALILTLIVGPITIAVGWFAYRPLLALAIIGAGVLIAAGLIFLRRKGTDAAPAQPVVLGRG